MFKAIKFIVAPLLLLIASVALFLPLILGFQIEKEVQHYQDRIAPNAGYNLVVNNYHRGWFRSTSDITLHIDMTEANKDIDHSKTHVQLPDAVNIHFSNIIHHGPFIITKKTGSPKLARAFIESTIVRPDIPIHFSAWWRFGGSMFTFANAEKIKIDISNGGSDGALIIQGLDAQQSSKHDFTKLKTHFSLDGFDAYDQKEGQIKIQNVSHQSTFEKIEHGFWAGQGVTKMGSLKVQGGENKSFDMQGLVFSQSSGVDNGRAKGSLELSINTINIDNKDYGKQEVALSIDNMDVEALNTLTQALEDPQSKQMPLLLPFGKTFRAALAFLSKGVHVSLDKLDVNTQWGRVNADADISLAQSDINHGSIPEVINHIKAAANFVLPDQFVQEAFKSYVLLYTGSSDQTPTAAPSVDTTQATDQMLQQWLDTGWLIKDSDHYKLQLRVEKSQIFVNDKPFHMPAAPVITTNKPATPVTTNPTPTALPVQSNHTDNGQQ